MYRNNYFRFFLDVVAIYRLTKLITDDRLTEELRDLIWDRYPPNTKIGYLITCGWCTSVWSAVLIFGLRAASPTTADYLSSVLAASAVVGKAYDRGL